MDLAKIIKFETDDVIRSEEDKRQYRALELANGLKILLISDPKTDKSAASLDVNVGSMHEPWNVPGLAHFCEHMLFMGTEKYPVENQFSKFLAEHGGTSNACTSEDHTNYHFDVDPKHFQKAIDIFAQFFITPLFIADAVEREACAVDSEYLGTVPEDDVRFDELKKRFSKPNHDYQKFGYGTRKTLLDDPKERNCHVREELLKFYNAYYSLNIMTLCVVAKESLDELKKIIVPMFSLIPNKNLSIKIWSEHPYGNDQVGHQLNIVPVKELRTVSISFPIPDLRHQYKSKPANYLSSLVGHEGYGSLLSELKKKYWAISVSAGPSYPARGFGFFVIDIELSEDGLVHVEDVVSMVFQYINMLHRVGPQEWFHREIDQIDRINFRFRDKKDPMPYAIQLANALSRYPLKEVLCAPYFTPDYKPELVLELMKFISINNFTIMLVSKSFEGKTDKIETWYGVEYKVEKISVQKLNSSIAGNSSEVFKFPKPNEFIPKNFQLWPLESKEKIMPKILSNNAVSRIWHKQDDEYFLPKCSTKLLFQNPLVQFDPLHSALSDMYIEVLCDHLQEVSYSATLAGLGYSFSCASNGIQLSVSGYNDKQSTLLNTLIENMLTLKPNPKRFEVLKEQYLRLLKDKEKDQPYSIATTYRSVILQEYCWNHKEILIAATKMNVGQLVEFIPRFFSALHVTAYVHGNITAELTKTLVDNVHETVIKHVTFQPLFSSQFNADREMQLLNGRCYVFEMPNDVHVNSAAVIVYQIDVQSTRENMLTELLVQLIEERYFDQIRTKEQLGYVVETYASQPNGVNEILFIVQGEKTAEFFDTRVEAFVESLEKILQDMKIEEFEKHKNALATKRLERPKELSTLANKYFSEILCHQYHFDRDNVEVEHLKLLSISDIIGFYQKYIKLNGPCRKKLSIYIKSSKAKQKATCDNKDNAVVAQNVEKISDVNAFKLQLPTFGNPKPYMEIPISGTYSI